MVKQTIKIFCRIKPTKQPIGLFEVDDESSNKPIVNFHVPKDLADGIVNNKKENYKFSFDRIFEQNIKQENVFEAVAQPVIDNVLSGFNGTIFAYGQTGSGKTFTITGGAERYADRGIIPRSLSHVYQHINKNSNQIYTVHISYLEIYNEAGYDLLDPKHEASKLEDLPLEISAFVIATLHILQNHLRKYEIMSKVSLLEDNDGNIHLKNLSLHQATSEEEALNLLFLGDTNRMIAETPMNQASTRSHCIFTIHVSVTEAESATIRRSKLHLVDLAGSERVGKTGVGGTLLKEAKYINLSLHFLEQVIIALSEKTRNHIPYRNSMMTSVLRDSLGGNCMTSMVATCSVEKKNIDESISTCRFAQRVALIKNDAILNEELDPKLEKGTSQDVDVKNQMIAKLKREIQQLKDELALATGTQYEGELTEDEKQSLESTVQSYIEDQDPDALLSVGADMRKINFSFQYLKKLCINNIQDISSQKPIENSSLTKRSIESTTNEDNSYLADKTELQTLKDLILQRDNEINVLVTMLKKEKQRADKNDQRNTISESTSRNHSSKSPTTSSTTSSRKDIRSPPVKNGNPGGRNALLMNLDNKTKASMSMGRQEAFEIFKRDYRDNHIIEEHKQGLKNRYTDAKKLGEQVNKSREAINAVKGKLEKVKIRRSLHGASSGATLSGKEYDDEEVTLRITLDEEKNKYKQAFNQLKILKTEIEHMQHLLEKSKVKLQKDFELWWSEQTVDAMKQQQQKQPQQYRQKPPPIDIKNAWKTPPVTPLDIQQQQQQQQQQKYNSQTSSGRSSINSIGSSYETTSKSQQNKDFYNTSSSYDSQTITHTKSSKKKENHSSSSRSSQSDMDRGTIRSSSRPTSSIRLTGDKQADEDILAFMKAREELMRKGKRQ